MDHRLRGVRMACDQVFHIGIAESSRDSEHAVDTVVQNQSTSAGNTASLVLIATFVVVREAEGSAVPAEHNASIANIGRVQHALTAGLVL